MPAHSPGSALLGKTEPRIFTPPLRALTPDTSKGFECIEFAEQVLGLKLLPWQEWFVKHALELNPDGTYRFRVVICLVARQNGKTTLMTALHLWKLYCDNALMVLATAQNVDIARDAWKEGCRYVESIPDLRAELKRISLQSGDQYLELINGAKFKIAAANEGAARGLSVDHLSMDELRQQKNDRAWAALSNTTRARRRAQVFGFSNMGDEESVVLNRLRDGAVLEIDEGTTGESTLGLFEWSAWPDCDLTDREAWAQANPGLNLTIPEISIKTALSTDRPEDFRTEVLCQKVDALDAAISSDAWVACADPHLSLDAVKDRVSMCLDVSPDLTHATLAVAGLGTDGRVRVEILQAWVGKDATNEIRLDLPTWIDKVKPVAFGWYPAGPAGSLMPDLSKIRRAEPLKGDVPGICAALAEQIQARRLLHGNNNLLTAQILNAKKLISGDGWRFTRRERTTVDAVYAVAGAVHLARTAVSVGKPRIIVARSA